MKHFDTVKVSAAACRRELANFKSLLDGRVELSETEDIHPFFRAYRNLASFIGMLWQGAGVVDRLAFEYALWGDFACDHHDRFGEGEVAFYGILVVGRDRFLTPG